MSTRTSFDDHATALIHRLFSEYRPRIRAYLRRADRFGQDSQQVYDEILGDLYMECLPLAPEADLWPAIVAVLRRYASQLRRVHRHEQVGTASDADIVSSARRPWLEALWGWEDRLLESLPIPQRLALEWHVMDDLDDATIAARLDVPVGRVRVLRYRAMRTCRRLLIHGDLGNPPEPGLLEPD